MSLVWDGGRRKTLGQILDRSNNTQAPRQRIPGGWIHTIATKRGPRDRRAAYTCTPTPKQIGVETGRDWTLTRPSTLRQRQERQQDSSHSPVHPPPPQHLSRPQILDRSNSTQAPRQRIPGGWIYTNATKRGPRDRRAAYTCTPTPKQIGVETGRDWTLTRPSTLRQRQERGS